MRVHACVCICARVCACARQPVQKWRVSNRGENKRQIPFPGKMRTFSPKPKREKLHGIAFPIPSEANNAAFWGKSRLPEERTWAQRGPGSPRLAALSRGHGGGMAHTASSGLLVACNAVRGHNPGCHMDQDQPLWLRASTRPASSHSEARTSIQLRGIFPSRSSATAQQANTSRRQSQSTNRTVRFLSPYPRPMAGLLIIS